MGTQKGRKMYLSYAIYAAEQVLDIYEKEHPNDKRPREAIEAARVVLKKDTEKNRAAARAAGAAARAAGDAAWAAARAAGAAARAAARAAGAAGAAARDARADGDTMLKKILKHGIKLLGGEVMKKAEIVKLTIKMGEKKVDVSLEEARGLYEVLDKMFGKDVVTIPQPYPVPADPYPWRKYPWYYEPNVIWCSNDNAVQASYSNSSGETK